MAVAVLRQALLILLMGLSVTLGQNSGYYVQMCNGDTASLPATIHLQEGSFYQSSCKVTVKTGNVTKLRLEFVFFELNKYYACSSEYLQLGNFERFCGNQTGKMLNLDIPNSNDLLLSYFSPSREYYYRSSSFTVKLYEAVPIEICAKGLQSVLLPVNITSPGYPSTYGNNLACTINFTAPKFSTRIIVKFIKFELERGESRVCKQDVLQIHNSRFCNNHSGEVFEISIPDTGFTVLFSSDGTIKRPGFFIEISYIQNICNPRSLILQLPLIIRSPGYPEVYPNNMVCAVNVATSLMPLVLLRFLSLDLEADEKTNCKFDILKIGNQSFCGNHSGETLEMDVLGIAGDLPLTFTSDDSEQRIGFDMEVSFPTAYDICEAKEITLPAYIKTPQYPDQYPNKSRCEIMIRSAENMVLEFLEFELENNADFFYMNETRYSGSLSRKVITLEYPANYLLLRFTSDKTISRKGFFMKITAIKPKN